MWVEGGSEENIREAPKIWGVWKAMEEMKWKGGD
jgi:hypothetical protein